MVEILIDNIDIVLIVSGLIVFHVLTTLFFIRRDVKEIKNNV